MDQSWSTINVAESFLLQRRNAPQKRCNFAHASSCAHLSASVAPTVNTTCETGGCHDYRMCGSDTDIQFPGQNFKRNASVLTYKGVGASQVPFSDGCAWGTGALHIMDRCSSIFEPLRPLVHYYFTNTGISTLLRHSSVNFIRLQSS